MYAHSKLNLDESHHSQLPHRAFYKLKAALQAHLLSIHVRPDYVDCRTNTA